MVKFHLCWINSMLVVAILSVVFFINVVFVALVHLFICSFILHSFIHSSFAHSSFICSFIIHLLIHYLFTWFFVHHALVSFIHVVLITSSILASFFDHHVLALRPCCPHPHDTLLRTGHCPRLIIGIALFSISPLQWTDVRGGPILVLHCVFALHEVIFGGWVGRFSAFACCIIIISLKNKRICRFNCFNPTYNKLNTKK